MKSQFHLPKKGEEEGGAKKVGCGEEGKMENFGMGAE